MTPGIQELMREIERVRDGFRRAVLAGVYAIYQQTQTVAFVEAMHSLFIITSPTSPRTCRRTWRSPASPGRSTGSGWSTRSA